jgi:riboflavin synthase
MFTGIISDIGRVLEIEQQGDLRARIGTGYDVALPATGSA